MQYIISTFSHVFIYDNIKILIDYDEKGEPMKIYNLKLFLVSIFVGGGGTAYAVFRALNRSGVLWLSVISMFAITVYGVFVSLSKKASEKDKRKEKIAKEAYRRRFGKLSPVMPYIGLCVFLIAVLLSIIFEGEKWALGVMLGLILVAVLYSLVVGVIVSGDMEKIEEEFFGEEENI